MEVNYPRGSQGLWALFLECLPRAGFSGGSWLPENRTSSEQNCPLAGEAGKAVAHSAGLSGQAAGQWACCWERGAGAEEAWCE